VLTARPAPPRRDSVTAALPSQPLITYTVVHIRPTVLQLQHHGRHARSATLRRRTVRLAQKGEELPKLSSWAKADIPRCHIAQASATSANCARTNEAYYSRPRLLLLIEGSRNMSSVLNPSTTVLIIEIMIVFASSSSRSCRSGNLLACAIFYSPSAGHQSAPAVTGWN
jgi:hypothetical protein